MTDLQPGRNLTRAEHRAVRAPYMASVRQNLGGLPKTYDDALSGPGDDSGGLGLTARSGYRSSQFYLASESISVNPDGFGPWWCNLVPLSPNTPSPNTNIPPSCQGLILPNEWSDRVGSMIRFLAGHCKRGPVIQCSTSCAAGECGWTNSESDGCTIVICYTATGAPSCPGPGEVERTLVHELTHCRQGCDGNQDWQGQNPGSCEERICREKEAYAPEGACEGWKRKGDMTYNMCLCRAACNSVMATSCYDTPTACVTRCRDMHIARDCYRGHYRPNRGRLFPDSPIWLPY